MICPYCKAIDKRSNPNNVFGAKYSCINSDHEFYYRNDYDFILFATKYDGIMLAQNNTGTRLYYSKFISNLETIHYSEAWITFQRIMLLKGFI